MAQTPNVIEGVLKIKEKRRLTKASFQDPPRWRQISSDLHKGREARDQRTTHTDTHDTSCH